jgi:rhamnogalacturonyl hydrolase YesR
MPRRIRVVQLLLCVSTMALMVLTPRFQAASRAADAAAAEVRIPAPGRAEILSCVERMADAQIARLPRPAPEDWTAGVFYTGLSALAAVSPRTDFSDSLDSIGDQNKWSPKQLKKPDFNADDQCVCQSFLDAFEKQKDPRQLAPTRAGMDRLVDHLNQPVKAGDALTWWWCDSLFMAPPAMAHLSAITGDRKYLDAMNDQWWRTVALLYDSDEHLFFRDSRFLPTTTRPAKTFWSRGNGWVFAGTARVLARMPADYPTRGKYVQLYRAMADRLATLQGPDGLWPVSLSDPQSPGETSGTALDCYGFAWGINHGLLDRTKFLPVVARAWAALSRSIRSDGLPGYSQNVGDRPGAFGPQSTNLFGAGAFLLAGSEILPLADALPDATLLTTRPATIELPRPAAVPAPARDATAFVRYVPERADDLAWENDRIAYRIFGPKIEKEDHFSSGIDVWTKSTSAPVVNDWYKRNDYHHEHGTGLDFYEVGLSRGCGGLGVWQDNKLWVSRAWKTYQILKNGPDSIEFRVSYAPWTVIGGKPGDRQVSDREVWQTSTFRLAAGDQLNQITTIIESDKPGPLQIGLGLARHGDGTLVRDKAAGLISYWQPADPQSGSIGVGLLVDPAAVDTFADDADNYLVILKATPGKPFTYRAGACWDRGSQIKSAADWEKYLRQHTR